MSNDSNVPQRFVNISICRFEIFPKKNPVKYVVAFDVESTKGGTKYFETTIPLREGDDLTDAQIADKAFEQVKKNIAKWYSSSVGVLGNRFSVPEEQFAIYASPSNIESGCNIDHSQFENYDLNDLS